MIKNRLYIKVFKPIIEFMVSLLLLIIASPVIVICFIALFYANDGKVFFIQTRPGYKEKPFKIIKFKTMNDKRDEKGNLLPDELRITYLGKVLRKLSIDELLQLINVLKGDMSLVGPRPLLLEYLPLYNEFQKERHNIKPGITGWAQVNGRNAITWEEKFQLDIYYVHNLSFLLDMKIVFNTILKILKRDGINSSNEVTMEAFKGTK